MTYADNTSVSVEKSRGEIERTLGRYGATAFGYMTEAGRAVISLRLMAHDGHLYLIEGDPSTGYHVSKVVREYHATYQTSYQAVRSVTRPPEVTE